MPSIIAIDDAADPRLEPYRDIRERDLTGRLGIFIAEGRTVIEKLLVSPAHRPLSMLIAAHRVATHGALLAEAPPEMPVYAVPQTVVDGLAGFAVHRGLLAIGQRIDPPSPADLLASLPARTTVVALSGIANHDNMGGIFRNAAAFGAGAILLDPGCCDPLYRKAIRVSVGAALLVPFARAASTAELQALLDAQGFRTLSLTPRGESTLAALPAAPRNAVWLGAEGPGLPAAVLARTATVRIPMAGGFDSLNVATTAGIVLHRLLAE